MNRQKKGRWITSGKLQFAAFMVAAPRFMSIGAMLLGVDLVRAYPIFFWLDVVSWLGLALLEGFAIPYVAKGKLKFDRGTPERRQLETYRVMYLLAIPFLGAPYYFATSAELLVKDVLWSIAYWGWSFLAAGIVALVIDAVGIVEGVNEEQGSDGDGDKLITTRTSRGGIFGAYDLARLLAAKRPDLTPGDFVIVLEREGIRLTTEEAEQYLLAAQPPARRVNGKRAA